MGTQHKESSSPLHHPLHNHGHSSSFPSSVLSLDGGRSTKRLISSRTSSCLAVCGRSYALTAYSAVGWETVRVCVHVCECVCVCLSAKLMTLISLTSEPLSHLVASCAVIGDHSALRLTYSLAKRRRKRHHLCRASFLCLV